MDVSTINYFRKINGSYNVDSKKDYDLLISKQYVNEYFDECTAYEKVKINDIDRELLIMNKTNLYSEKSGIKFSTRPNETVNQGDLILWKTVTWICDELDPFDKVYCKGYIRECNNTLKWVDSSKVIQELPCIFQVSTTSTSKITDDKYFEYANGVLKIIVQKNEKTMLIEENSRIIFDHSKHSIYEITDVDVSSQSGLIIFTIQRSQYQPDSDRLDLNLASYEEQTNPVETGYSVLINGSDSIVADGRESMYIAKVYQDSIEVTDKLINFTLSGDINLVLFIDLGSNSYKIISNDNFDTGMIILKATMAEDASVYIEKDIFIKLLF